MDKDKSQEFVDKINALCKEYGMAITVNHQVQFIKQDDNSPTK